MTTSRNTRQVERVQHAVRRLDTFPESGRFVPEFEDRQYREVIDSGYRIIYRPIPERETVLIVAVYHGRQQLPSVGDLQDFDS